MMKRIELVTFDLDNTLWDVGKVVGGAENRMRTWLAAHAAPVLDEYLSDRTATRRAALVARDPGLRHDLSALRVSVMTATVEAAGYPHVEASAIAEAAFEVFLEARHDVEYFDGALEALARLSARYQLGALSNGNAAIARLGLDRFFEFAFSAADVGASKPAPAMFERALAHAGVEPERAVHVGDHLVDDIAGASNLGMHTILVEVKTHPPLKPDASPGTPSRRISALTELVETIDTLG